MKLLRGRLDERVFAWLNPAGDSSSNGLGFFFNCEGDREDVSTLF